MENEIRQLDSKFVMRYQIFESKNSKIYFGYQNQKNCTELTIKVLKQNNVDNTIFQSILQKIQKLPSSNAIKILFFGTGRLLQCRESGSKGHVQPALSGTDSTQKGELRQPTGEADL